MAEKGKDATWSLAFWLLPMIAAIAYGVWCIKDGWFRPGYEHKSFSQIMAPVSFAAAIYCLWKGINEYRKVSRQLLAGGQEGGAAAGDAGGQEKKNSGDPAP